MLALLLYLVAHKHLAECHSLPFTTAHSSDHLISQRRVDAVGEAQHPDDELCNNARSIHRLHELVNDIMMILHSCPQPSKCKQMGGHSSAEESALEVCG